MPFARRLRPLRWLMWAALGVIASVAAYFMVAFGLLLVPANRQPAGDAIVVQAYVMSNGVHTDLVFPLRAQGVDWSRTFPSRHLAHDPGGEPARYVAIGWGDREFYLHTPRWRDLTAGRALQALSGSGHSLLHVTHLHEADLREGTYALPLTEAQYASLVQHVEASLVRAPGGEGAHLPGQHYGPRDAFYEARGSYNLFTTCNVWTGRALRQAGVKVSVWTPLASQVVWHLPAAR